VSRGCRHLVAVSGWGSWGPASSGGVGPLCSVDLMLTRVCAGFLSGEDGGVCSGGGGDMWRAQKKKEM
jgi:hypothetical protein